MNTSNAKKYFSEVINNYANRAKYCPTAQSHRHQINELFERYCSVKEYGEHMILSIAQGDGILKCTGKGTKFYVCLSNGYVGQIGNTYIPSYAYGSPIEEDMPTKDDIHDRVQKVIDKYNDEMAERCKRTEISFI
jgi:hypothetical protein